MILRFCAGAAASLLAVSSAYAQLGRSPDTLRADAGFLASSLSDCRTDLRYLNQISGWQSGWPREWQALADAGAAPREETLARWRAAPQALADAEAILREGIANKETAPRPVVMRVRQQIDDLIGEIEARNPRYFASNGPEWNALLTDEILPAIKTYKRFLEEVYLPAAREKPGISLIENGEACFYSAVEYWTTLSPQRDEIEATGKRLLAETRADLAATGEEGESADDIIARLRAGQKTDPTTAPELIAISEAALARADDALLEAFEHKAQHPIDVVEMPLYAQPSTPAGYYLSPEGENGFGHYVINPSRPGERRLMAEAIAFHEGLPGHHLSSDYPREVEDGPFNAGLLEGWGLYAEYVADELGLYSSQFDRQGMMAKHLWASSRLIVEPGLHLRGWSREKAIRYMLKNTLLERAEIEIEVDRYIAMPGHSLSYMLGADLLMSEREKARALLGEDFDIRAYHELILAGGTRPLPVLRQEIRDWAEAQKHG